VSQLLAIRGLRKRYADVGVLAGLDLDVEPGEIVALVGPSGCGKSTLLRLIAGLDMDFSGEIVVGSQPVRGPSHAVGLVFQEPRLFPWLSVADNVGFGLKDRGSPAAKQLVNETLGVVGLATFANALPKHLSGGMAQRVALARALVTEPQVLLMDEPFSALDAITRDEMNVLLLDLWERYHKTALFVTHSIREAVLLSDRILVMGGQPSTIVEDVRVPFPRPRDFALTETAPFNALCGHLRAQINEARRTQRAASLH
jgi:NitT/TauT family transport system ATP-binding protein